MRRILVTTGVLLLLPSFAFAATVTWSSKQVTRVAAPAVVDSVALRAATTLATLS
jgi:hypothetical protein